MSDNLYRPLYRVRQLNCVENTTRGCGYSKTHALDQSAVDKYVLGPELCREHDSGLGLQ